MIPRVHDLRGIVSGFLDYLLRGQLRQQSCERVDTLWFKLTLQSNHVHGGDWNTRSQASQKSASGISEVFQLSSLLAI